tara:strand:+ start:263848 stop:264339 length:492 start_codon:yes stop_codon:yes gene_type:complete
MINTQQVIDIEDIDPNQLVELLQGVEAYSNSLADIINADKKLTQAFESACSAQIELTCEYARRSETCTQEFESDMRAAEEALDPTENYALFVKANQRQIDYVDVFTRLITGKELDCTHVVLSMPEMNRALPHAIKAPEYAALCQQLGAKNLAAIIDYQMPHLN